MMNFHSTAALLCTFHLLIKTETSLEGSEPWSEMVRVCSSMPGDHATMIACI